jgi:hypothetical protein
MSCRSSSLSISLLAEQNEQTHYILFLFLIVYRHCISKDIYRLSPPLVTLVRCFLVRRKKKKRAKLFLGGKNKIGRQSSVVFLSYDTARSLFFETDSNVILLVRQVDEPPVNLNMRQSVNRLITSKREREKKGETYFHK